MKFTAFLLASVGFVLGLYGYVEGATAHGRASVLARDLVQCEDERDRQETRKRRRRPNVVEDWEVVPVGEVR